MTTLAAYRDHDGDGPARASSATRPWVAVDVSSSIEPMASAWRELERDGLVTPYQSLGWVRAFVETVGAAQAIEFRFVLVSGAGGRWLAILPLVLTRSSGCRFARFIGGKHANYHMGVYAADFASSLTPHTARLMVEDVAAAIGGLDALVFVNQPLDWRGVANPLALLPNSPSPSAAYRLSLAGEGDPLTRSMSSTSAKKLRHKRKRFAAFGNAELVRAQEPSVIAATVDAFLAQKAARFEQMKIADPFAEPGIRAFLTQAAAAPDAAIELYSLELEGRCVATYVGAVHGGRFSGMATAFALDTEVAKASPGEILLVDLIGLKHREGFTVFDLGVGEARYKTTICDARDELFDSFLPLTAKGRAVALVAQAQQELKRRIKASPVALGLARRLSGLLQRRRAIDEDG